MQHPARLDLLAEVRGRGAIRLNGALTTRNWLPSPLPLEAASVLPVAGVLAIGSRARGLLTLESSAIGGVNVALASAAIGTPVMPHWLTWSGDLFWEGNPVADLCLRYDAKRDLIRTLRSLRLRARASAHGLPR